MKRVAWILAVLVAGTGLSGAQDEKKKDERFAVNAEQGVSIQVPGPGGKDQLWEASSGEGPWFGKNTAVSAKHKIDNFSVSVLVQRLEPNTKWPDKITEVSKGARDNYTKKDGDKEANFKECRLKEEDPKAKIGAGITGKCVKHHLLLTANDGTTKREIIEYFCISSEVLYRVTLLFDEESYAKHMAKAPAEGLAILNMIKKVPVKK